MECFIPFPNNSKLMKKPRLHLIFFKPQIGVWKLDEALFCMFGDYIA